ncbi:DUF6809 family protein [uncultured Dysosmobacter sp.]|uniref:DUF6809 family protein n=1 Tax=uncultured Dysosmobacter sp. TaxID=2591384 RepID=UPI00345D6686
MRRTLEDTYYGNIIPCDRQIAPSSNLERAMDQAQKCEEKLVNQQGTQESLLGGSGKRSKRDLQHDSVGKFHPGPSAGDAAGRGDPG